MLVIAENATVLRGDSCQNMAVAARCPFHKDTLTIGN